MQWVVRLWRFGLYRACVPINMAWESRKRPADVVRCAADLFPLYGVLVTAAGTILPLLSEELNLRHVQQCGVTAWWHRSSIEGLWVTIVLWWTVAGQLGRST